MIPVKETSAIATIRVTLSIHICIGSSRALEQSVCTKYTQKITGWDLVLLPHEWMRQAIFCGLIDLPQVLHAQVFWLHLLLHRLHKWRSHTYQRVMTVWTLNSCNWTLWKVMPNSCDYDFIKFLYDIDCHSITTQLTKQEPNSPKLWKNHNL